MTPEQVASSLAKGLGRLHVYLKKHAATPHIKDAILDACLYNKTYDPQFEGDRTKYLFELMELTGDPEWFRQPILNALMEPDEDMDIEQLMDFAVKYAQEGDSCARQLLYEKCGELALLGEAGVVYPLIDLDGLDGFLYVANRLGEVAVHDPEFTDGDFLLGRLQEKVGRADLSEIRMAAQGSYPFVKYYLERYRPWGNPSEETRDSLERFMEQTYEELKATIENTANGFSLNRLNRRITIWGKEASEADIEKAAQDLLKQNDTTQIFLYLSIFGMREFPLGHQPLLPYVWVGRGASPLDDSKEEWRITMNALSALRRIRHPEVRELGFQLIKDSYYRRGALELFINNYEAGDEPFFLRLLNETKDPDEYHDIGFALNNIIEIHLNPAFYDVLVHQYENNPCSYCRHHFIEALIKINSLPNFIREEAVFDSNEETRKLAGTLNASDQMVG